MSRTNARKDAFCLLFQRSFVEQEEMNEAKTLFFEENPDIDEKDKAFILENVKLVDFVINRRFAGYYRNENTYDDLKQIGIIGLIKSVDSFDENKGNK